MDAECFLCGCSTIAWLGWGTNCFHTRKTNRQCSIQFFGQFVVHSHQCCEGKIDQVVKLCTQKLSFMSMTYVSQFPRASFSISFIRSNYIVLYLHIFTQVLEWILQINRGKVINTVKCIWYGHVQESIWQLFVWRRVGHSK